MKIDILKYISIRLRIKNILILFLFVIGIPSICSLILGYEMRDHQIQHIPTVIIDHDNSAFSQMLVKEIKTNEIFNVVYYSEDDNDVKNLIEQDKVKVGVIIPNSFSKDLNGGNAPKVLVFYDGSQMSITSAAKSRMDEILLTIKTGYLKKLMEGKLGVMPEVSKNNALPMYFTYRLLNNPTKNYSNFLIPGMLISVIQVGLVMIGTYRVRSKEKYYLWMWLKSLFWGVIGGISLLITLGIQFKYFAMPFRGSINALFILTFIYSIGTVSYGMLVRIIIPEKILAIQIGALSVLPTSIIAGFTYPLLAMPTFFQEVSKFLPFVNYAEAIRDLCVKDISFNYVMAEARWLSRFLIYTWVASLIIFICKKLIKKGYYDFKNKHKGKEVVQV